MIGITSYGGYIPRLRIDRQSIYQATGWLAPATIMVAQGERSLCNWDEDSLTMAVASAWDCVQDQDRAEVDGCYLCSTTLPFLDRQNAGVVKAALNLKDEVLTADFTACLKSGTTALVNALEAVRSGREDLRRVLVTATDKRETKAAYFYEMWFGDGAASLLVGRGEDEVIAEFKGSHSISHDFVDHYRGPGRRFDYMWEERWVRDLGYTRIIPEAVGGLLDKLGLTIKDVDKLIYPCFFKAEHRKIGNKLGASPEQIAGNMHEVCGETGAAHPLVMLVEALEGAKAGDKILVASFGQGSDALLFEVTQNIEKLGPRRAIGGSLENKKVIDNYLQFLKFRDLLQTEMGIRAEVPMQTAMTVLWRNRKMLLGMVGGKCRECGTAQFPKAEICVNPSCGAHHAQDDYEFAREPAKVKTFTADLLAVSVDPPSLYGMIQFDRGGRLMIDFTDCELDDVKVGQPVSLSFRKRYVDEERGFAGYFWKAVPEPQPEEPFEVRFDDRVAIVTGAGGGLGRVYAMELAKRGAKVVVNDLGGGSDGSGSGEKGPADKVVDEIREAGGEAVASYDSVATAEGGEGIVETAIDAFGKVDILINNAGILRDKSLAKLTPESWQAVIDVHLHGAYNVTRPAFVQMKRNGYGRIVMTSSAAGLYGNFGQTNYSAAKMGLVGLMSTLRIEGKKAGITTNTVAPVAASRLTESIFPTDVIAKVKPELVAPLVLYLCSEECRDSGLVLNAGAGAFNRAAIMTGRGAIVAGAGDHGSQAPTPEQIQACWDDIHSLEGGREHADAMAFIGALLEAGRAPEPATSETDAPRAGGPVQQVFDKMPEAFDAEAAASLDVTFQFNITGSDGGTWNAIVKAGKLEVRSGQAQTPTVTIEMADADFVQLIQGKLDAMAAYSLGKLKVSGDIMKSRLIMKLFKFA